MHKVLETGKVRLKCSPPHPTLSQNRVQAFVFLFPFEVACHCSAGSKGLTWGLTDRSRQVATGFSEEGMIAPTANHKEATG